MSPFDRRHSQNSGRKTNPGDLVIILTLLSIVRIYLVFIYFIMADWALQSAVYITSFLETAGITVKPHPRLLSSDFNNYLYNTRPSIKR